MRDEVLADLLATAGTHPVGSGPVWAHAAATARLREDADAGFTQALAEATRVAIIGPA